MSNNPRDEAQRLISHLSEIGIRHAGSPQEATAAAFVNAQMRRVGMGVTTSPLQITPRRRRLYGAVAACGLFAALSTIIVPLPALLLAVAAAAILLLDVAFGPLMPIGPRISSQSIIGTQAIARDESTGPREPRWRVVMLAPLDSPAATAGVAALAWPTRSATLTRLGALALIMIAALIELLSPRQGWALLALPATMVFGLQIVALLRGPQLAAHDGSLGALAALLLASRELRGLRQVELWAVAVGATALDVGGVEDLLRSYPFDPARTLMIAVEQLAGGPVAICPGRRGGRQLADLIAADLPRGLPAGAGRADLRLAGPLQRRGLQTVTLCGRAVPAAASRRGGDTQLIHETAGLIVGVVRQLEQR